MLVAAGFSAHLLFVHFGECKCESVQVCVCVCVCARACARAVSRRGEMLSWMLPDKFQHEFGNSKQYKL